MLSFFQKENDKNIIDILKNKDYNIEPEEKANGKIYNSVRNCYYTGKGNILKAKILTISKTDGAFQGISYYTFDTLEHTNLVSEMKEKGFQFDFETKDYIYYTKDKTSICLYNEMIELKGKYYKRYQLIFLKDETN